MVSLGSLGTLDPVNDCNKRNDARAKARWNGSWDRGVAEHFPGSFFNIQFHIGIVTQITSHLFDISTLVLKKVFIPKYKLKRKCYVVFDKCLCYQICFHTKIGSHVNIYVSPYSWSIICNLNPMYSPRDGANLAALAVFPLFESWFLLWIWGCWGE